MTSDKVSKHMRNLVLSDAEHWYATRYPRSLRSTCHHSGDREHNNELFAEMNAQWDDSLMKWYEKVYVLNGGDISDFPWPTNEDLSNVPEEVPTS